MHLSGSTVKRKTAATKPHSGISESIDLSFPCTQTDTSVQYSSEPRVMAPRHEIGAISHTRDNANEQGARERRPLALRSGLK